jgi:hypothetical protein
MKGYYISIEKANELGLLENPITSSKLQKVIIAITENDVLHYEIRNEKYLTEVSDEKIEATANWFYRNYFDSFLEINFHK